MGKAAIRIGETEFVDSVIELAQTCKWLVAHFRPAKTEKGWRTPVQGDGKGFPDLVLVSLRPPRKVLIVEAKAENGKVSPEQHRWLEAFAEAGIETHIWRPGDWPVIESILRRKR